MHYAFWLCQRSLILSQPTTSVCWLLQGQIHVWSELALPPPFWQINHANSAYFRLFLDYFRVISAIWPPLLDLGPPFYISWIRPCYCGPSTCIYHTNDLCKPEERNKLINPHKALAARISSLSFVQISMRQLTAASLFKGISSTQFSQKHWHWWQDSN